MGTGRKASAAVAPAVGDIAIYICREPVDFRLGINGLSVSKRSMIGF